jgi:TolB-like protein
LGHWLTELRRRNVDRIVIAYLAATWLVAQVAQFLGETFAWPVWVLRALVIVLMLGLPVAAAVAWFFELTPTGLVREQDLPAGTSVRMRPHRAFDVAIAALVVLAIGYFAATQDWRGRSEEHPRDSATATLAVLPFKPIVASSRDEALEFGMADTLITRLCGVADMNVSPLSSVRRFVALDQDPIAAGRELGVESVLDGSVQKSGERLRVTARLLRVADGRQLWSDRFDEDYTDIFSVQDSIADRVTQALAVQLSPDQRRRVGRQATVSTVAYDMYLNGRYYWNRRRYADDLPKAAEFYAKAIAADPEFALAYSGLADVLAVQGIFGMRAPDDVYPKALAASDRALELDPDSAEAHATRGHLRTTYRHDWSGALEDFDEAIRHDPRYAMAHLWRGYRLAFVGRQDEGLIEMEAARVLEPDSLAIALLHARGLYWARRFEAAESEIRRVLEVDPGNHIGRSLLANVYDQVGRSGEALEILAQGQPIAPGSRSLKALTLAAAGRLDEARAEVERLESLAKHEYVSAYDIASASAAVGDMDRAFRWLDQAVVERASLLPTIRIDPVMNELRKDPRYVEIERKIGIPRG